jgi:hypothetical protein
MPLNPLSIFYRVPARWELHPAGYVSISWKCDPDAIPAIGRAGNFDVSGVSSTNIEAMNNYFDRLLIADPELTNTIVTNLYRVAFKQQKLIRNNCWFNFITSMTVKAACHTWNKIPKPHQSEELFERLVTPTLSIQQLLAGFNPEYQPHLLVGLQAWTYQVVKYNSFADLRTNGHPYFGLSNLGVVSRSSYKLIRTALVGNITTSQIELYISICKVFKNYLARSSVSTNKLASKHWQELLVEVRSIDIKIAIAELQGIVDRVGSLIRAYHSLIVEKYDDPHRSILIDRCTSLLEPNISESTQVFSQLFTIIDRFISSLPTESQQIITLRHQQRLKQGDIAKLIFKHQSKVSRKLGEIYLDLIDLIHTQVPHPDGGDAKKNSRAIEAIEQLLEQYFHRD